MRACVRACCVCGLCATTVRIALAEGDMATAKQLGEVVQAAYPTFGNVPEVKRAMSMLELAQGADGTTPT